MSQPNQAIPQRRVCPPMTGSCGGNGRLASYLTAGVAGATMATAHSEAAVVAIDVGATGLNITGANAGVANGNQRSISDWLGAGTGRLELFNSYLSSGNLYWGLDGDNGLTFAVNGTAKASPRNFGAGAIIDGSSTWTGSGDRTSFRNDRLPPNYTSPDFGANSFMGFRFGTTGAYYFGYFEVTWTSSTNTFQILSGAYESTVNTAILVPAPSALALLALGGGAFRRARARAA
jgi:hypothetical protein